MAAARWNAIRIAVACSDGLTLARFRHDPPFILQTCTHHAGTAQDAATSPRSFVGRNKHAVTAARWNAIRIAVACSDGLTLARFRHDPPFILQSCTHHAGTAQDAATSPRSGSVIRAEIVEESGACSGLRPRRQFLIDVRQAFCRLLNGEGLANPLPPALR